jgi:hypothetical protein
VLPSARFIVRVQGNDEESSLDQRRAARSSSLDLQKAHTEPFEDWQNIQLPSTRQERSPLDALQGQAVGAIGSPLPNQFCSSAWNYRLLPLDLPFCTSDSQERMLAVP